MVSTDNLLYPTPERVSEAKWLLRREFITGETLHPVIRANCEQVLAFDAETSAARNDDDQRDGILTMTESEFQEELRKAREEAWEEGTIVGVMHFGQMQAPLNPYAERKMTPAEIEEWRKTCPYPEDLGA